MQEIDFVALYQLATDQGRFTSIYWQEGQMMERRTYVVDVSELNLLINQVRHHFGDDSITFIEVHRGPAEKRVLTVERRLAVAEVLSSRVLTMDARAGAEVAA